MTKFTQTKENLDLVMTEYYYAKNDIDSTLEFLAYMFNEYSKLKYGE